MKHLRKYTESLTKRSFEDFVKYVESCFIEFSDEEKYDVEIEHNEAINELEILLFTGYTNEKVEDKIDFFLNISNELNEFYLDINVAIKRILDEYPEFDIQPIVRNFVEGWGHQNAGKEYISIVFKKK
jgi:hypothetical protein